MNGISYETFGDFFKTWHFVTVRYRRDTGEMRFTYANDIAWEALKKGNVGDYPEGAAFAKVGVTTQDDPAFSSSVVPSGVARYQIMLREHGRHPETQGWTYAIFLGDHLVHGTDSDAEKSAACAACHAVVAERGYVFSQPVSLDLAGTIDPIAPAVSMGDIPSSRVPFRTVERAGLPSNLLVSLPSSFHELRLVDGPIAEHVFAGSLDEIRPVLAHEVLKSGLPAALISKDGSKFSLVFVDDKNNACSVRNAKGVSMQVFHTSDLPVPAGQLIAPAQRSFCETAK
jgi:hypothetical protein